MMKKGTLTSLNKAKLRRWLGLFFLALFLPTIALVLQAYSQLKWEAFHQYNIQAEELTRRIDDKLSDLVKSEASRAYTDYSFLNVAGDPKANFLQRSPLSKFPIESSLPGLLGYFQVDAEGRLSTPLLPQTEVGYALYGIPDTELKQRLAAQDKMHQILSENQLVNDAVKIPKAVFVEEEPEMKPGVAAPPAEYTVGALSGKAGVMSAKQKEKVMPKPQLPARVQAKSDREMGAQAAFDLLSSKDLRQKKDKKGAAKNSLGRVDELKLNFDYQRRSNEQAELEVLPEPQKQEKRRVRKERSVLAEAPILEMDASDESLLQKAEVKVRIFESEVDEFRLSLLGSGHFVIYRNVWRGGQRFIQGALMEQGAVLEAIVERSFNNTALSQMSDLIVAYQGDVIRVFNGANQKSYLSSAQELTGELLHRAKLSDPLNEVELLFNINRLPPGPGQRVIHWVTGILMFVLVVGFYLLYRLAAKQLDIVKQQQDFVSAVSHELKTPLTSIRMYGEMLLEGWASEDKKKTYYAFIHDESERLSRLINNVLQLARMTRNELDLELEPKTVSELLDSIRSKTSTQIEQAGFQFELIVDESVAEKRVLVDMDSFCQVIINLVDNAIKFTGKTDQPCITVSTENFGKDQVVLKVRDYGPGIPKSQLKKIFKLFYRSNNELTRETMGTGIGLALVHQLVTAMDGSIDVVNKDVGAEFRVVLPTFK